MCRCGSAGVVPAPSGRDSRAPPEAAPYSAGTGNLSLHGVALRCIERVGTFSGRNVLPGHFFWRFGCSGVRHLELLL
jgi:hypothetical protein